ncbi:MAG TPA: polysaccharide deacetylase family protein, partial [Planctomycetota bacterium]|nr:polysaccharide deacetylase family protein [Planctomycetota bacterium]
YDADPADRDRVCAALFCEVGGDEARLAAELYLSWDDARALQRAGFELGGHTRNHVILSRLGAADARAEVEGCRADIERELGKGTATTFAYPFGRRWDYTDETRAIVREAGFPVAVNTHAGVVGARTDPTQLERVPVDDTTPVHLLVAEACGGFELLRKLGVDLSE